MCSMCGSINKLEDTFVINKSGGNYCKDCVDIYFPGERKTSVSKLINKVVLD